MKLNLNLLILLIFIILSNCEKLVPKKVQTTQFSIFYNYWYDLLGQEIKCPNDGVIKNFVFRKTGYNYYYDLQCYSSETEDVDYGEPIVKDATYINTLDATFSSNSQDISALNTFEMDCTPEYGLNGFKIYLEKEGLKTKIKKTNYCKPTKSSYVSQKNIMTQSKSSSSTNLDCFVDILVGSTETETEEVIGYPLRSFKFMIGGTPRNRICYYIYSYSKLKNMGVLKDQRLKQFAELRNKNTQAD